VTKCFYAKGDAKQWHQYRKTSKNLALTKETKAVTMAFEKPKLILKVIQYFKPTNSLEIGTSLGLVASAIKIAHPKSTVTTLENSSETANIAEKLFSKNPVVSINAIVGDFRETIPKATTNKYFDLIFFNRTQTEKETFRYFESCLSSIHNETFFIFKDIYSSKEMKATWDIIKQHPKVTVTVDVFYYGFVFFRKEQEKEHFKIRI
jgi:predicted O-methyltransferase YrrM